MGDRMAAAAMVLLALGVGGCGKRDAVRRDTAVAPPAALAPGAVNPDAGVTTYACVDGQTVTAGYPDRQTAVVTYKDHAYTLKLAPSASGARYTGYGLQWWTKGARASIAALEAGEDTASAPGLDCAAQGQPAAGPVTHTSFAAPLRSSSPPIPPPGGWAGCGPARRPR